MAVTISPKIIKDLGFPSFVEQNYPSQRLHQAVSEQNVFEVRSSLNAKDPTTTGVDIESKDSWQRSPLALAARRGNSVITAYLLNRGANPIIKSRFGDSPVMLAAANAHTTSRTSNRDFTISSNNHVDTARILMSHRAVTDVMFHVTEGKNMLGETALHAVARSNNEELIETILLLNTIQGYHSASDMGQTPIDVASTEFRALYNKFKGRATHTPTMTVTEAIAANNVFEFACQTEGLSLTAADTDGLTALHHAAAAGATAIVTFILQRGGNYAVVDKAGRTPLALAILNGHITTALVFLSHNSIEVECSKKKTLNGETLLHLASRSNVPEMVRVVLAFDTIGSLFDVTNNQLQKPSALSDNPLVLAAFYEVMTWAAREAGLSTPVPLSPAPKVVCAVCLTAPPTDQDSIVYSCPCMAPFCEDCFTHLCQSSINAGSYPVCCNAACSTKIPFESLARFVPISTQLTLLSLLVNEKTAIEAAYKHVCSVCNRVNSLQNTLQNPTPRYSCNHCGVNLCSVCSNVWPGTAANYMDDKVHQTCTKKFTSLNKFFAFQDMLNKRAQRICPSCKKGGQKDEACSHMTCCERWCYVCGRNAPQTAQNDISSHGNYDGQWKTNVSMCPMYLNHMAMIDDRVAAVGCPDRNCRPSGSCNGANNCAARRDRTAQAIVTTMRVRVHILEFMQAMGKEAFIEMLDQFNWRSTVDQNYFGGTFDWASPTIPHWSEFEPENVRQFYLEREQWFNPTVGPNATTIGI